MIERFSRNPDNIGRTGENSTWQRLFTFAMSAMSAMMLCMEFPAPWGQGFTGAAEEMVGNLSASLHGKAFLSTLLCLGLYRLSRKVSTERLRGNWVSLILSGLIAAIWLLGAGFTYGNGVASIYSSPGQILKSAIYYLGSFWLIHVLLRCFCMAMDSGWDIAAPQLGRVGSFLQRHRFWAMTFFLLACWAVPLAVCYPAVFCVDTWVQLAEYWGTEEFTAAHPPVYTILVGASTRLGMKLGNVNMGLFLLILVQSLIYALVFSGLFRFYEKLGAPLWLRLISFLSALFSPFVANRVGMFLKDAPYSIAFLLVIMEYVYALMDLDAFMKDKKHQLLTVLAILGVMLTRNNGKIIVFPSIILIALVLLIKGREIKWSRKCQLLCLVLLPAMAAMALNGAVMKHYDVAPVSVSESLSLPFQQTARYVRDHGEEVTEEEREAIDAILPYDKLAELYNPSLSDPIKSSYRPEAGKEELGEYLKVWAKMFFKRPTSYVLATVNQFYPLVYPAVENKTVYVGLGFGYHYKEDVVQRTGISQPETLATERNVLEQWFNLMYSSPVIGMVSHTAPYTIIAFFLCLMAVVRKKYAFLMAAMPVLMTALGLVLAPAITANPRYAFPIVYAIPALTAYFIWLCRKKKTIENGEA